MEQKIISQIRTNFQDLRADDAAGMRTAAMMLLAGLSEDGHASYPLPVVRLLQQMGFGLFRTGFSNPNQSGLIAVDSSLPEKNKLIKTDRVVLVNQEDSTAHQRFTIAHEFAHYIFDFDETKQATYYKAYLTTEKDDAVELRANRFAAELLMPTDAFKAEFKAYKGGQGKAFSLSNTITHLCQYFDAPVTAVKKRLEETGCLEGA